MSDHRVIVVQAVILLLAVTLLLDPARRYRQHRWRP
jgi:hypothetical protein